MMLFSSSTERKTLTVKSRCLRVGVKKCFLNNPKKYLMPLVKLFYVVVYFRLGCQTEGQHCPAEHREDPTGEEY